MAKTNDFILGDYPDALEAGDWDPTGNIEEMAADASGEMLLEAEGRTLALYSNVTACFRTADGKVFLKWLKDKTIELPAFFPENYPLGQNGAVTALPADQQGFIREGQNMIFREIKRMIQLVDNGPSEKLTAYVASKESSNERPDDA